MCCFALIVGSGLLTIILCNVVLVIFISCLLAASTVIPRGYAKRRLYHLPPYFGMHLYIFPPRGAFVITASIACHFQSIPVFLSYTDKPSIHIRLNTPADLHSWNLSCTVLEAPRLLGRAFHWQPVRKT